MRLEGAGAQDNEYLWCFAEARRLENAATARISFKSKRNPQHTQVCMPKPRTNDQQINKQDTGGKNKSPSWYSHSHDMHGKLWMADQRKGPLFMSRHCSAHCKSALTQYVVIFYSWPESAMVTVLEVLPLLDPTFSTAFTTSIPSTTCPNTTCLPSSHGVGTVHRKN